MTATKPDWIFVLGSTADAIQKAITTQTNLCRHDQPTTHRASIALYQNDQLAPQQSGFAIWFDPPIPPYAFANLIGWLDDPKYARGSAWAVGWLTSPKTGVRYYLYPKKVNHGGDTLMGCSSTGTKVSVFLPDISLTEIRQPQRDLKLREFQEPELTMDLSTVSNFEITVDSSPSFGNPGFIL